jgi:hypothetical protein
MVGGLLTSFLMELVVYPVIYRAWRRHGDLKGRLESGAPRAVDVAPDAKPEAA